MKITKETLKKIIQEELEKLQENPNAELKTGDIIEVKMGDSPLDTSIQVADLDQVNAIAQNPENYKRSPYIGAQFIAKIIKVADFMAELIIFQRLMPAACITTSSLLLASTPIPIRPPNNVAMGKNCSKSRGKLSNTYRKATIIS